MTGMEAGRPWREAGREAWPEAAGHVVRADEGGIELERRCQGRHRLDPARRMGEPALAERHPDQEGAGRPSQANCRPPSGETGPPGRGGRRTRTRLIPATAGAGAAPACSTCAAASDDACRAVAPSRSRRGRTARRCAGSAASTCVRPRAASRVPAAAPACDRTGRPPAPPRQRLRPMSSAPARGAKIAVAKLPTSVTTTIRMRACRSRSFWISSRRWSANRIPATT
jgi:hypothetical protein